MSPTRSTPEVAAAAAEELVVAAQRDAEARDEAYQRRQDVRRRRSAPWMLVASLPFLAAAAFWNARVDGESVLPPPDVEALDLARTLRLAIAEIDDHRARNGNVPQGTALAALLPESALLVTEAQAGEYELTASVPGFGDLRYRSDQDPDRWLVGILRRVDEGAGR